MKRMLRYLTIVGMIMIMSVQVIEARTGRGGSNGNHQTTQQQPSLSSHRPSGQQGVRPGGNQGNHNQQGVRPGGNQGNHNQQGVRPGGVGSSHGGNHNSFQPGHQPGHQPVHQPGHQPVHQPVHQPGHAHVHHPAHHPVHTPHPPRHDYWPVYHRPTPPPHYVYHGHGPSFTSILGMVLGTAYNMSLNYLYSNGYTVTGYNNNAIYLSNVNQMNYIWPNVVLYYNGGLLTSSQYIYSTSWNDVSRYNRLYSMFCNQYGVPVSVNNAGGTLSASWFGYDGRFVTIQYSPGYNANGYGCYYTTLSFGN